MLEPCSVDAYGTHMPLNQLATVPSGKPRMISVRGLGQVDGEGCGESDRRFEISACRPPPKGHDVLRLRHPRAQRGSAAKELVKSRINYAEACKSGCSHMSRRDGLGHR